MANALYWLFVVSATILATAYLAILASVLAAKRRMSTTGLQPIRSRSVQPMRYRIP